ncbi:MAG TPA: hypothetical protein VL856_17300 [Acidimicrobiia bacterium]|nr:hypothetical protein [Acidimicrobiia bacterium]
MMRRGRVRRHVSLATVITVVCAFLVGSAPPAHAVLTTQSKILYDVSALNVPQFVYDKWGNSTHMPGCTHYPGVSMDGNVLAKAYITTSSYVKLYFTYGTHYDANVAIAKAARPDFSCFRLAQFEKYKDKYPNNDRATIQALNDSGCATPAATFWNSWCRLAAWELDPNIGGVKDPNHVVYKSLSLDLNTLCRQPTYVRDPNTDQPYNPPRKAPNGLPAYRGPARYVDFKDPGVTLGTQNFDGAVNAGVKSGLDSLITTGGLAIELGRLISGSIGFDQFAQDILTAGVGLNMSTLGFWVQFIEFIVLAVFDLIIDARNAPVMVGDFTFAGGRADIDPGSQRPDGSGTYGQYVGYGKVQNLAASNDYANWLTQQAVALYNAHPGTYVNPALSAANAIYMQRVIANKIANNTDPLHAASIAKRGTYCVNKDSAGNVQVGKNVPWMATVMETWPGAPATVSEIALDYMLRQFAFNQLGVKDGDPKFICNAAQESALATATHRATVHAGADDPSDPFKDPWLRAALQCQVGTIGKLITSIWIGKGTDDGRSKPNFCMNRYPSITKHDGQWHFYAPDFWATVTDKDFHCGENEHFQSFFSLLVGFL